MVILIHDFYGSSWAFSFPYIFGIIMIISSSEEEKQRKPYWVWTEIALIIHLNLGRNDSFIIFNLPIHVSVYLALFNSLQQGLFSILCGNVVYFCQICFQMFGRFFYASVNDLFLTTSFSNCVLLAYSKTFDFVY